MNLEGRLKRDMKTRKTTTKKATLTPKANPALKWSHGDTNEELAIANEPYGQAAFNIYYSVDSLPPMLRDAIADAISGVAKTLGVPDPASTRGEVEAFKRLIKVCKAAADQESAQE